MAAGRPHSYCHRALLETANVKFEPIWPNGLVVHAQREGATIPETCVSRYGKIVPVLTKLASAAQVS